MTGRKFHKLYKFIDLKSVVASRGLLTVYNLSQTYPSPTAVSSTGVLFPERNSHGWQGATICEVEIFWLSIPSEVSLTTHPVGLHKDMKFQDSMY